MRRMVEGGRAGLAARSAVLVLAIAPGAFGDGDGPELTPPSDMPGNARPTVPARPRPSVPAPSGGRAVLALPGITTPSLTRPPSVITSTPSSPPPTAVSPADPGEMSLDQPLEMPGLAPVARPRVGTTNGRAGRPLPLDPLPMDESSGLGDPDARADASVKRPSTTSSRPDPASGTPARRGRLFGLVPGTVAAPPAGRSTAPGRSVVEDSPGDPAVDSALKRRIEKQAREAAGDRVRLLDVRVVGKEVSIQARGVRFYQKRAVRKSLESIPALSGLRSSIVVLD